MPESNRKIEETVPKNPFRAGVFIRSLIKDGLFLVYIAKNKNAIINTKSTEKIAPEPESEVKEYGQSKNSLLHKRFTQSATASFSDSLLFSIFIHPLSAYVCLHAVFFCVNIRVTEFAHKNRFLKNI